MKRVNLVVFLVAAVVVCGTVAAFARSPQTYTYVLVPTSSEYSNPDAGGALKVTVGDSGTEWFQDYSGKRWKVKYWWVTWDIKVWGLMPDTPYLLNINVACRTDVSGSFSRTYTGIVYTQSTPDPSNFSVMYHDYLRGWVDVLVIAH